MAITLKEMRLSVDVYPGQLDRVITDLAGNIIWEDSAPMDDSQLDEAHITALVAQMQQLPVWNIVEVNTAWH